MLNTIKKENSLQPATFGSVVDQIFQNNLARFFDDSFWGSNRNTPSSRIPVNIRETDSSYEMELIAPGLQKEDFTLNVTGDMLTVAFEHKNETNAGDQQEGWVR